MLGALVGDEVDETADASIVELVYGADDGIVTTFADGFSMGMSNFLSRRSELDYRRGTGEIDDGKRPVQTALATFLAFVVDEVLAGMV